MTDFVDILVGETLGVNSALWPTLSLIAPLVIIIFLFAFSYNILRDWLTSRKINAFMSAGGLHTDDYRLRRWVEDL